MKASATLSRQSFHDNSAELVAELNVASRLPDKTILIPVPAKTLSNKGAYTDPDQYYGRFELPSAHGSDRSYRPADPESFDRNDEATYIVRNSALLRRQGAQSYHAAYI